MGLGNLMRIVVGYCVGVSWGVIHYLDEPKASSCAFVALQYDPPPVFYRSAYVLEGDFTSCVAQFYCGKEGVSRQSWDDVSESRFLWQLWKVEFAGVCCPS